MMERKAYTAFGETGFGEMGFGKTGRHRRHLVNAYEGKAGMVYLQVKLCDPCLSALRNT